MIPSRILYEPLTHVCENNTEDKAVPNRAYTTEMDIYNSLIRPKWKWPKITIDGHQDHATANQIARILFQLTSNYDGLTPNEIKQARGFIGDSHFA